MGQITFQITGGTPDYQVELIPDIGVSWTYGSAGIKTIYDIPAGDYAIRITDSNGCVVTVGGIVIEVTTTTTEEGTTTTTPQEDTTTTTICEDNPCYGLLYNWFSVNDAHGLGIDNWRIPSDDEWKDLEITLGMTQVQADNTGYRGTDQGTKMKLAVCETTWTGTNSSGFSALPGGYRADFGDFNKNGTHGAWWTSSIYDLDNSWSRLLVYYDTRVYRNFSIKTCGFSVRCVRDYYEGYPLTIQDIDGNTYDIIHIGNYLWTVQNLQCTHYKDGTLIPNVIDATDWHNLNTGACCAYNNDWETYACIPEPTTTTTTETTTTTTPIP